MAHGMRLLPLVRRTGVQYLLSVFWMSGLISRALGPRFLFFFLFLLFYFIFLYDFIVVQQSFF